MHKNSSVFDAELQAIQETSKIILEGNSSDKTINISDSQAVLKALRSSCAKSPKVLECQESLEELATRNKVNLIWVPGHEGHPGNEHATGQKGK